METFPNGDVFTGRKWLHQQTLNVEGSRFAESFISNDRLASSRMIFPGLVDLQVYGAAGHLFSANPSRHSLIAIEDALLEEGTTGFLICVATNTLEVMQQSIEVVRAHFPESRNCLGIHLEGPYIHSARRGAHVERCIRKATLEEVKRLVELGDGCIKMMTLAPELQDEEVLRFLQDHQVTLSIGHSNATFEEAEKAFSQGIYAVTHLFNAMPPLHHRDPGLLTAVFNHPEVKASIIADGHHVDYEVLKMAAKWMEGRLFLITDAVTDCQQGPYRHQRKEGRFVMPDGTLSGSALSMWQAVKNVVNYAGVSLEKAVQMASLLPAEVIEATKGIGQIVTGGEANFIVVDHELNLRKVYFRGEEIKTDNEASF